MPFSSKAVTLAIIPKISGFLSILGSTYILQDVLLSSRRNRVYCRLLVGLSIFDIFSSVSMFLSTWPVPKGSPGVPWASGTTQTCSAQGFFIETGNICAPLYNLSLCVYNLLIIRYGWGQHRMKRIEVFLHLLPWTVGWTMGILGIPYQLYNFAGFHCWIAPYPRGCQNTNTCTRGQLSDLFRWIHYGIVWAAVLLVTFGMVLIYWTVSRREEDNETFLKERKGQSKSTSSLDHSGDAEGKTSEIQLRRQRKFDTDKLVVQLSLYVLALYLTWTFTSLLRILQITVGKTYFSLLVLMAIFFPMQGFFNFFIYVRPRFVRHAMIHPDMGFWERCRKVLFASRSG